jgi:DNA-binding beta-propeller fold protein YncE
MAVAVDERTDRAFVVNHTGGSVSVLDLATGDLLRTTQVGARPHMIALDEAAGRVFVVCDYSRIAMLDAQSGRLLSAPPSFMDSLGLFVDDQTHRLFFVGDGWASTFDGRTGRLHRLFRLRGYLRDVKVDAPAGHLFTYSDGTPSSVSMFSVAGGESLQTVSTPGTAGRLAVDVDTKHIFAVTASNGGNNLYMLDGRTGALLHRTTLNIYPIDLEVDRQTGRVFIAGYNALTGAASVSVVDGRSGTVLRIINAGPINPTNSQGVALVVDKQRSLVFFTSRETDGINSVRVLDARTARQLHTITVGSGPRLLALDEHHGYLLVVNGDNYSSMSQHSSGLPGWLRQLLPWLEPSPPRIPSTPDSASIIDVTQLQ